MNDAEAIYFYLYPCYTVQLVLETTTIILSIWWIDIVKYRLSAHASAKVNDQQNKNIFNPYTDTFNK